MSQPMVLGVEVSPNTVRLGLVEQGGKVLQQRSFVPNQTHLLEKVIADQLGQLLKEVGSGMSELQGVGLSAVSHVKYEGLAEQLKQKLGVPCWVTHTGNASALAERMFGQAKGWEHYISVSIDADLQCGIITNGGLAMGEHGLAGGLGHMLFLTPNGRERLVDYISESGIKRAAWRLIADRPVESSLKKLSYEQMTAAHIVEAAKKQDKIAQEVFQTLGAILGAKLADVVHHFSPSAFIFNSTLPALTELLLPSAQDSLNRSCLAVFKEKARLFASTLPSDSISVLGAASIAWHLLGEAVGQE